MSRFVVGLILAMSCSVALVAGQPCTRPTVPMTDGPAMLMHRPPVTAGTAVGTTSENWAGYVQLANQDDTFTAVTDTLVIPTAVTPVAGAQYESDWVGVGGFDFNPMNSDVRNLIQAGVQVIATTTNDKTKVRYEAWTEKLPGLEKRLPLKVNPGNFVSLTVQETATNRWTATVDDITTDLSTSRTVRYKSDGLSAEAIEERPCLDVKTNCAGDAGYAQLAQTSDVTFDPGSFSEAAAGAPPVDQPLLGTVPQAALLEVTMVDSGGSDTAIATPSPSNADDNGFTVADGSSAPPPPGP